MRDTISIQRVNALHPIVRTEVGVLIDKAEALLPNNYAVRIVQGLRTFPEQKDLYDQGRTKPGKKVTNAKPGSSYHNYGLSIDFALMIDKDGNGTYESLSWDNTSKEWATVVKTFEDAGWTWGGNFSSLKDYPHLEKTFGLNWRELLKRYNAKDFIPGTTYVRI